MTRGPGYHIHPARTFLCAACKKETTANSPLAKYCVACSTAHRRERDRLRRAKAK